MDQIRPPAVPLITVDPYFSIWSFGDNLYDTSPRHWTGAKNSMHGMIKYNGKAYRFMGETADCSNYYAYCDIIPQKSVNVKPTITEYVFENNDIELCVNFISPLLLNDLHLLARPISYIEYNIKPKRDISNPGLYFDIACEACVNNPMQEVKLLRGKYGVYCGNIEQKILEKCGDDLRIDWGYMHLFESEAYFGMALQSRASFIHGFELEHLSEDTGYIICEKNPVMAVVKKDMTGVIALGYDDIKSIEYLGNKLNPYYRINGDSFEDVAQKSLSEFEKIKHKCRNFDDELTQKAEEISPKYAEIISLTYRQTIAAHKLCYDDKGMIFISKECYSNGCAATLDITYPSMPLFLLFNPDLVKAMMRPIFDFAVTDKWKYDFAPHDVGCYPLVNGQVYGLNEDKGRYDDNRQMPIEECGNALICTYAICRAQNDFSYAMENKDILIKWGNYLLKEGFDPGNQLCTDDFGGHVNHNCNLSVKAIVGIYICGELFGISEMKQKAKEYAKLWKEWASDGEKYRMAFDAENTWSLKYNMVWDKLFGFNLFDEDIYKTETAYYEKQMSRYGIPLDYRSTKGKLDWIMWVAAISEDKQYRDKVIDSVWNMINETKQRVPLTDYYDVDTGKQIEWGFYSSPIGFSNRSVLGGFAILLLKEDWL